jgi:hypothetical protein
MASYRRVAVLIVGTLLISGPVAAETQPAKPTVNPTNNTVLRPMTPVRAPLSSPSGGGQSNSGHAGPPFVATTPQLRAVGGPDVNNGVFRPVERTTAQLRAVGGPDVNNGVFKPVEVTTGQLRAVGGP